MKRIVTLVFCVVLLSSCSLLAGAKEADELPGKELAQEIIDSTPDYVREWIERMGVDEITPEKLLSLNPKDFTSLFFDCVKEWATKPIKSVGTVLAIIILCVVAEAFKTSSDTSAGGVFSLMSSLAISTVLVSSCVDCVRRVCISAEDFSTFITGYVPVFASSVIASGQTASGGVYSSFMLIICQIISSVSAGFLLPLLGAYLAISIVNAVNPSLKINMLSTAFKSCVTKTMGFSLAVFVGMMSLQTLVASGSDNLAVRAGKYLVGNLVPVVGSAISEVFLSVQGYMKLMKTCIGWYGVLAAVFLFLPVLVEVLIWKAAVYFTQLISQTMNLSSATAVLEAISSVFTMLLAFILTFAMLLIVTTTIMLLTGMG